MPKFQIELPDETYNDLAVMALEELRQTPQQAAWVLILAMRERNEKRALVGRPYSETRCYLGVSIPDATATEE